MDNVSVDSNLVIQELTKKLANEILENATLKAYIETLKAQISKDEEELKLIDKNT